MLCAPSVGATSLSPSANARVATTAEPSPDPPVFRFGRRRDGAPRRGYPARWSRSANWSAITTLRCRPPVQPTPIDRYALPFLLVSRQQQIEEPVELVEELAGPGLLQHVVAHRLVPAGERAQRPRPSAGSGGSGSRSTMSTSSGSPCLYPNDTTLHLQRRRRPTRRGTARATGPAARGR